ncbi:complement resistance protein TraT [Rubripirellula sp.]|nr:complement resistance protein TraT [Rubripirellula sp.]
MFRSFAASLGALAMGLVALRGAILGEPTGSVALEAITAMAVFAIVGGLVGWIADTLVRDAVERAFRKRVEWYREELSDAGLTEEGSKRD